MSAGCIFVDTDVPIDHLRGSAEAASFLRDAEIATRHGPFRRDSGKRRGVGLADALLAATADVREALSTLNARHFPVLSDVLVPRRKTA